MKPGVAARLAAARALGRVLRGGAWSNVVVDAETVGMSDEDRRLVRRLVFGVLRNLPRIDRALAAHIRRELSTTDPAVLDLLRVSAYEVTAGGGVSHAAVNSAVEAVREAGRPRAAGFVNAVLRNLIRHGEPEPLGAANHGIPLWLVDDLAATLGPEAAEAFVEASDIDAPRTARIRPGRGPVAGEATALPDLVVLPPGPLPDGAVIQDVASAAAVYALGDVRGKKVLDMAAAPGGKTLQVYDAEPDLLVACDVHPRRLNRARRRLAALGYPGPWIQADGRALPFPEETFDRILLDAPCTGLGTLRRRPELRYRVNPSEVQRLAALQQQMLAEARRVLAPGGRIVYSVCTVTSAETQEVVADLGGQPPDLPLGRPIAHGRMLTPHEDGTDGMFISVIDG